MPNLDQNTVFGQQLHLAWEHFKFHAEQRMRMFYFFLLVIGLLLNAFSLLIRSGDPKYQAYAFVLLCIGGLLSTFFLSLDIRNVQLLEQSEDLLRKIEKDTLYTNWRDEIGGEAIKLGILSREAVLKDYVRSNVKIRSGPFYRWFFVDNIKHKLSIRFIQGIAILFFWIGAYAATPPTLTVSIGLQVDVELLVGIGLVLCLAWGVHALTTPQRYLRWEQEALEALKPKDDRHNGAEGTGSS